MILMAYQPIWDYFQFMKLRALFIYIYIFCIVVSKKNLRTVIYQLIDWPIDFNCISISHGLFYAYRLGLVWFGFMADQPL